VGGGAIGLAWWGSLLADAVMGRATWPSPVLGAALLVGWCAVSFGGLARRVPVLPHADADAGSVETLYWQDAAASWQDAAGSSVSLQVVFDLGRFCLLKRVPAGECTEARHASFHWIDASPEAGHLPGPWRWRVMMASSGASTSPITALAEEFPRPAGRPS
jgi:hypothetical protein